MAVAAADQDVGAGRADRRFDTGLGEIEHDVIRSHRLGDVEARPAVDRRVLRVEQDEDVAVAAVQRVATATANDPVVVGITGDRVVAITSINVAVAVGRSEEHTADLQSLMRNSYAAFRLNNNT